MIKGMRSLKYVLWIGSTIPIILVLFLVVSVLRQFNLSEKDIQWVEHTHEVLMSARKIEKLMIDMETGQRGFIITGQANFLEPFSAGKSNIFSELDYLKGKVRDNLVQVTNLERIEVKIKRWLEKAGMPEIEARRKFDRGEIQFSAVSRRLIKETGKRQIDDLREILHQFISMEEMLIQERQKAAVAGVTTTKIVLFFGSIFVALVSILTSFFVSKNIIEQDWIKSTQSVILANLQDVTTLGDLADRILGRILLSISVQIGSLYISPHVEEEEEELRQVGVWGIEKSDDRLVVKKGKGLVGQCFASGEIMRVTDIPGTYFDLYSSLGRAKPTEIIMLPIKFKNRVIAIIELASFSSLKKKETILLNLLLNPLGIIMNGILSRIHTEVLLTEIQSQTTSLESSEKRSLAIINNSVDGIITIDPKALVQSFSPSAERIFGYSAEEVIGENIKMLMPAPYHDEHDGYIQRYHDTGEKRIISMAREVEGKRKDGHIFPMRLGVNKVMLDGESLFVGSITDITEQKIAQKEIERQSQEVKTEWVRAEKSAVEAKAANAAKSEFLANMSHELRTPMHAITGFAELGVMCMEDWSTAEQIENLEEIKDSGARLLALLNDLLDISKLEADIIEFDFGEDDLREIVGKVIKSLKILIDDKKLNVHVSETEMPVCIECDSNKIVQVITNLLSNAIKFTPDGKNITIRLEESTLSIGKRKGDADQVPAISLSMIDEGIGIPENELESIFDKFIQSSKTKTGAGGTGLGLAISTKIIDGHMGKIWADHNQEGGTVFTFTIPLKQPFKEVKHGV